MKIIIEKKVVPLTIFDEPCLQERISQLFDTMKKTIRKRIHRLLKFLSTKQNLSINASYDDFFTSFQGHFYKYLLNQAIEISVTVPGKYNILDNILSLLSKENLEEAIMGDIMIKSFLMVINRNVDAAISDATVLELERKFLGIDTIFEEKKNVS